MFTIGLFYVVYLQMASPPWVAGSQNLVKKNHQFVDQNPGIPAKAGVNGSHPPKKITLW